MLRVPDLSVVSHGGRSNRGEKVDKRWAGRVMVWLMGWSGGWRVMRSLNLAPTDIPSP
jgi:hypothetical protein